MIVQKTCFFPFKRTSGVQTLVSITVTWTLYIGGEGIYMGVFEGT